MFTGLVSFVGVSILGVRAVVMMFVNKLGLLGILDFRNGKVNLTLIAIFQKLVK